MTKPKGPELGSMKYYLRMPKAAAPAGRVIVHNHIKPPIFSNGFRAWSDEPSGKYVKCRCSWAPHLGAHYRVNRKQS